MMVFYILISGTAHDANDRYIASTALVGMGWACWIAASNEGSRRLSRRWLFVATMALLTSYLLLYHMAPKGFRFYGTIENDGEGSWWNAVRI